MEGAQSFRPITEYYAESADGCRIVKHFSDGVPDYQAWHPKSGWLAFSLSTAKEAADVCRKYAGEVNAGCYKLVCNKGG
ncbi:MAG: hypothetical protein NT086_11145 [Proteobacteria bacterium]|nr:hypothetical protein [Pseudomonadota bacterium]